MYLYFTAKDLMLKKYIVHGMEDISFWVVLIKIMLTYLS